MKKYLKDERGAIPFLAAIFIGAVATAVASGAIQVNKPVDLNKLKGGQAVYIVNQ